MFREHHKKLPVAENLPTYRQGRNEKAVKVYTINQESKYLLVVGVPAIGVREDMIKLFALYGDIDEYRHLDEYPCEEFTEVYWIKFCDIAAARVAKRKLDDQSFMGGILHVCYAPEYETIADTREKLEERRSTIERKLTEFAKQERKSSGYTKQENAQQQVPKQLRDADNKASSVLSTSSPRISTPCHHSQRQATHVFPPTDPVTSAIPPTPPFTNETSDSCFYLPPLPGSLHYSTVYYQSTDPLDPDQPMISQPKKRKTTETSQFLVSKQQSPSQVHKKAVGEQSQLPRKVRLSQTPTKALQKHCREEVGSAAVNTSDLGFFSTSFSKEPQMPLSTPLTRLPVSAAPQTGSDSLDVSARSIREKISQLDRSATESTSSVRHLQPSSMGSNYHDQNQTLVRATDGIQSLKKRKHDKRKRI